jgi:hypothetical protein
LTLCLGAGHIGHCKVNLNATVTAEIVAQLSTKLSSQLQTRTQLSDGIITTIG